jgi:hypothetical protein
MAAGEGPRDWVRPEGRAYRLSSGYRGRYGRASGWASLGFGAGALLVGLIDLRSPIVLLSLSLGIIAVTNGIGALRIRRSGVAQDVLLPGAGIGLAVVGTILMLSSFVVPHYLVQPSYITPLGTQQVQAQPAPVTYATQADEHHALLMAAQGIASSLASLDMSGQPMPTDYNYTNGGLVRGEPSGDALGVIPVGASIETMNDPSGKLQTLTLVGPTFGDRVTLDVGKMGSHSTT